MRVERRDEFIRALESRGSLDLRSPEGAQLLESLGATEADLGRLGNGDSVIEGPGELRELFDILNELDRTRPARSNDGAAIDRAALLFESRGAPAAQRAPEEPTRTRGPGVVGTRRREPTNPPGEGGPQAPRSQPASRPPAGAAPLTPRPREPSEREAAQPRQPGDRVPRERPAQTARPAQVEQPVQTARAAQGEQPVQTARAAQGEQPVQTARPAQGEQPVQTARPAQDEQPGQPINPSEPRLVATGRNERTGEGRGAREVPTYVAFTRELDSIVDRMASLPQPAARRGREREPSVRSYLDAIDAWQGRANNRTRRPEGVSREQWALARACEMNGISAQDVRYYLATGTLPDLRDQQGNIIKNGEQRLEDLHRAATQRGSWTAVNSFTFLIGMRRAALAADSAMLTQNRDALPANAPERAQLDAAIAQNREIDRSFRTGLNSIYTAATYARERTSRGLVGQGDRLEEQARRARARGDSSGAAALEQRAQAARDQGARMAFSEATYRAGMRGTGWNAGSTFRVAAQAQIARGQAEVAAMERTGVLAAEPPAVLGIGDATATPNRVPGAQNLLASSRRTDAGAGRDHEQLALENARHGALANFHRAHLDSVGYFNRAQGTPLAVASQGTLNHRRDYLNARVGQLQAADQRMAVYGDVAQLRGRDALDAQRVEGQRADVLGELNTSFATSLTADRAVADGRRRLTDAEQGVANARSGVTTARQTFGDSVESESDTRDRATGLLGDVGKTGGQANRDQQSITDARTITDQSRVQVDFAANGSTRAIAERDRAASDLAIAESQQRRDRQDAALARTALARRGTVDGQTPPATIDAAYQRTRADTDAIVARRLTLARTAEISLPPAELTDNVRAELGGVRVDAARWTIASTELDARVSQDGRRGAETRLTQAGTLLNEADTIRTALPAGEPRAMLAAQTIHARSGLAEAWADYRPGASRDQLLAARGITVDLNFDPSEVLNIHTAGGDDRDVELARDARVALRDRATERIGTAAVTSLARSDVRLSEIVQSGHHVWGARDQLYRTAHTLLDNAVNPSGEARDAQRLLARYDRSLAAIPEMLEDAAQQLENGQAFAAAQTRAIGRAEIAMAQSQVSSLISGPAWLFTAGHFDMKEEMATVGQESTDGRVRNGAQFTNSFAAGARDLAGAYTNAARADRRFDFIDSMRIAGDPEMNRIRRTQPDSVVARTYVQSYQTLGSFMPQARVERRDFQDFLAHAVRGSRPDPTPEDRAAGREPPLMYVPVARAMTGPTLGLADSRAALGDRRLAVMTSVQQDLMIASQVASLNETKEGQWRAYVNLAGEVAVGFILTGGAGSARAVAGAVETANVVRVGIQGANAARMALTWANAARTAGHAFAVGTALMGASYGVRQLFGASSSVAHGFDTATNFIPFAAMQRASGFGRAVAGIEQNATRLAQLGRILRGAGIAGGQAVFTAVVTNEAAQRGWVRSELGQMALGLGLNTVMAGGMGAYAARQARQSQARALSAGLIEHLAPEQRTTELSRAVARDVDQFLSRSGDQVPTETQMRDLRTRLYEHLGAGERVAATPDRAMRRDAIDHYVESVRVERAINGAYGEAVGREPLSRERVERLVEVAGERLFTARGGEGQTSRSQAYRDAAMAIATGFEVDARRASVPADATRLREAQTWARDRMIASDIANGMTAPREGGAAPLVTEAQRPRVERVLLSELSPGENARPISERAAEPGYWTRVSERLQREGGLSQETANAVARAAERDLAERGLISMSAAGEGPSAGFAAANPVLARQIEGVTGDNSAQIQNRAFGAAERNRSIRQFIENGGAPAARLVGELGEVGFMRAFGDGEHVSFRAGSLLDVPPARQAELAAVARERPADVQILLRGLETDHAPLIRRAVRDEGVARGVQLASVAHESPRGLGYLSSRPGGEAEVLGLLRASPDALATRARAIEPQVFLRATDGTYLLRGPAQEPAPRASRADLEGVARRAGVDPAVLDNPNANPRDVARVMAQMRSELNPQQRSALDRELSGRRFVDHEHFEEARNAGVENPEHRYGRRDFEAWGRAEAMIMSAAREGRPLTIDLLREAHAAATEGILAPERRGRIRSLPTETARQGGEGQIGVQEVSAEQLAVLRANRDLQVGYLGEAENGRHRVMVEYLPPDRVLARTQEVLQRIDQRLAAGEDPIAVAADAQRELVSIHPFMDGNGRMTRLVMDYVLAREGLSPSVVRDPNMDTMVSPEVWRDEVRLGTRTPFRATLEAWSRARAETPEPGRGGGPSGRPGIGATRARSGAAANERADEAPRERPDVMPARRTIGPGTQSAEGRPTGPDEQGPIPTDRHARRRTVGWSGEPTQNPPGGQEHLGVIYRGRERMTPARREYIDALLDRAANGSPEVAARERALVDEHNAINRDHGRLLTTPDRLLRPDQVAQKQQLQQRLGVLEGEITTVGTELSRQRSQARGLALREMERFRRGMLGDETAARERAGRLAIEPSALAHADEAQLRAWAADFYQLVPNGPPPEGVRLVHSDPRAHAEQNGALNIGDSPTRGIMFHELGHYIEYQNPALGDAARAWVLARSRAANGGTEARSHLNTLSGGTFYRPNEHAFEDHFETPYIGKDYGAQRMSEVLTVGLEYFNTPERMLQLYQRDPEHFFFVLGAIRP